VTEWKVVLVLPTKPVGKAFNKDFGNYSDTPSTLIINKLRESTVFVTPYTTNPESGDSNFLIIYIS